MDALLTVGLNIFAVMMLALSAAGIALCLGRSAPERLLTGDQHASTRWTAIDSGIVFFFYLGTNFGAGLAAAWLSALLKPASDQPELIATIVFTYLFNIPVLGLIFLYAGRGGSPLAALGLAATPRLHSAAFGLMFFLLFIPFGYIYPDLVQDVWYAVFGAQPQPQAVVRFFYGAGVPLMITLTAAACIVAPVIEETVFRGFIQRGLENSIGTGWAIAATAVLFSVVHVTGPWRTSAATAVELLPLAVLLSLIYARTRNLMITIVLHGLFNASSVALLLAARGYGVDLTR